MIFAFILSKIELSCVICHDFHPVMTGKKAVYRQSILFLGFWYPLEEYKSLHPLVDLFPIFLSLSSHIFLQSYLYGICWVSAIRQLYLLVRKSTSMWLELFLFLRSSLSQKIYVSNNFIINTTLFIHWVKEEIFLNWFWQKCEKAIYSYDGGTRWWWEKIKVTKAKPTLCTNFLNLNWNWMMKSNPDRLFDISYWLSIKFQLI